MALARSAQPPPAASAPCGMGPLLRFWDPAAEQRFRRHHAALHCRADLRGHASVALIWALVALRDPRAAARCMAVLCAATSGAALWLAAARPGLYKRWRERIIACATLQTVVLCIPVAPVVPPAVPTGQSWAMWVGSQLIQHNKMFSLCLFGVGLPLPLCAHLPTSAVALLALLATNSGMCAKFEHHFPGSARKYTQAFQALSCVFGTPGPLVAGRQAYLTQHQLGSCALVQAFVQLALGGLVPTAVVYCMELRARQAFQLAQGVALPAGLHAGLPVWRLLCIAVAGAWYAALLVELAVFVGQDVV